MKKFGKKYKSAKEKVANTVPFNIDEGIEKVREAAYASFDESVDVSINLGIDPSKGDQVVRGSVILPHSSGKKVTVIVFAKGDYADKAVAAGADHVGSTDLIEKISGGWMDFDYAVATPDMMGAVGKLAKQLGPRGLLPNKKVGTVTFDVESIVTDLKKGRSFFKNDKSGLLHFSLGKLSLDSGKIKENFGAFVRSLLASRPAKAKGKFIKKVTLTSTMGPGVPIDPDSVLKV